MISSDISHSIVVVLDQYKRKSEEYGGKGNKNEKESETDLLPAACRSSGLWHGRMQEKREGRKR